MPKNLKLLAFSILISHLAGIIGSLATSSSINNWYVTLNKPFFNPPNWLFGPVWLTLYTLMGISLYLVWIKAKKGDRVPRPVLLFLVHLVLNALWSIVFFGMKNLGLAIVVIASLLALIIYLINMFYKIDTRSAYLLIPYALWVSFATVLNISLWILN